MNTINNDSSRSDATDHDRSQHVDISRDSNLAKELLHHGDNSHSPQKLSIDTTNRAILRPDTPGHDLARPDLTERDTARQDDIEQEIESEGIKNFSNTKTNGSKPGSSEQSSWIDIDQTVLELEQKGIKRTVRSIQRYCQKGKLICKLIPTENAVRYLIERTSIDAFVKRHNQTMPSVGFGSSFEDRQAPVEPRSSQPTEATQAHITQSNQHSEIILSLKDKQIDMLTSQLAITNKQLDMKDEQISALLERDHETNVLIQNLQNFIALPSAGRSSAHPSASMANSDIRTSSDHQTEFQ